MLNVCRGPMPIFAGVATVALVAAAAPGTAWAQSNSPDLRATAVSSPAWADPLGALPVTVTITNRGSAASPTEAVRLYLSKDKTHSTSDGQLRGSIPIPAVHPGKHVTRQATLALPKGVQPGRFWLLACVSGHCAAKNQVHVTSVPKTSGDLIDAARKAGKISAGTAITYQVLAEFGDDRLPAAYRGDDAPEVGDSATRAAVDNWSSLSAAQQKIVGAYLQGPASGTAWTHSTQAARRPRAANECTHKAPAGMAHVDAPSGPVRIWYLPDDAKAAKEAPQLAQDAALIYQAFKNLMGRSVLSDADYCGYNGGDGHYDAYIFDPASYHKSWKGFAVTVSYKGYRGQAAPAFTAFSSTPNRWELAHELFHAFQFAYKHAADLHDYAGFDEGAANWAANYVYPDDNEEHRFWTMLTFPSDGSYTLPDNGYGYETWVFDLYLTEKFGNQLIPEIYQDFQSQDALTALNTAIPGGFADRLPDFTKYGWNQDPAPNGFRKWDGVTDVPSVRYNKPIEPENLQLNGLDRDKLSLADRLAPLTRAYYSLHVDDSHIHDLLFRNTAEGVPGASVQAFVKLANGSWKTQDWTNKKTVEFCRDNGPDEHVTDLVIMYANARYQDTKPLSLDKQPTLEYRNNCDRYYRVTAVTGSYSETMSVPDHSEGYSCTDSGTETYTLTVDPAGHLGTTDGSYTPHGIGLVSVPATLSGSRDYHQTCTGGSPFLPTCQEALSGETGYLVGFGDFDGTDPAPVQLTNPSHDSYDQACDDDGYGWMDSDNPQYLDPTSVPIAKLTGTAPFTVSSSNNYDDDQGHVYATSMSVTLQPTDEDGKPLQ